MKYHFIATDEQLHVVYEGLVPYAADIEEATYFAEDTLLTHCVRYCSIWVQEAH
jgi:hypothetical protein